MIQKLTFRDQIREFLLNEMMLGKIKPMQRLSLPDIAKQLEVSVTPIREALTQLTGAGIAKYIPNRGFFVPDLGKKEAEEIYPILAAIESMAVANSSFSKFHIEKLQQCQDRFSKAETIQDIIRYDFEFHDILIEAYDNKTAQRIAKELKVRCFFYELSYMNEPNTTANSNQHHQQIIEKIKKGQITEAITILQKNWNVSFEFMLELIENKK